MVLKTILADTLFCQQLSYIFTDNDFISVIKVCSNQPTVKTKLAASQIYNYWNVLTSSIFIFEIPNLSLVVLGVGRWLITNTK